jgi:hypothetical protein
MTNVWVRTTIILSVLAKKILYLFKKKFFAILFYEICGYKNGSTKEKFSLSSFGAVVGSGTDKNRDPG